MTLKVELETYVKKVLDEQWSRRAGQKVPDTEDIALRNDAVELDATVLYADLAGSTKMVNRFYDWFSADMYKSYLYCASKVIRANGGSITAYDGDRVMGVFLGDTKNSSAAKAGLQINWATKEVVNRLTKAKFTKHDYTLKQRVGIDTSKLFVARTGIRGSNDLVWVGNAANNAAKMAALDAAYPTYITASVYNMLLDWAKIGGTEKKNMWTNLGTSALGYQIYGSSWTWSV